MNNQIKLGVTREEIVYSHTEVKFLTFLDKIKTPFFLYVAVGKAKTCQGGNVRNGSRNGRCDGTVKSP